MDLMTDDTLLAEATGGKEHFDVLIVGAGISGIAGAYHLRQQNPGTRYVILESMESFGGTWLSHKYPGIRSDSDLYTFGYRFKPWVGPPIALAEEIRKYMGEVIAENDLVISAMATRCFPPSGRARKISGPFTPSGRTAARPTLPRASC